MFEVFSVNLCLHLMQAGYSVPRATLEEFADMSHFSANSVQMGSLINIHIIDGAKVNTSQILEFDAQASKRAQEVLNRAQHVTLIYIVYGGRPPEEYSAKEYVGQKAYSVFWSVCAQSGEILTAPGQPADLFSLRSAILTAAAAETAKQDALLVAEARITRLMRQKHSIPLLTYAIILANAVVLLLMYRAGYPDDFWVPMRFGAIVPHLILEDGQWYRLFAAMFVHFGVAHLAANALGIFIFGSRIEKYLGRGVLAAAYVITGLCGSLASLFLSQAYAAGASGAVYGLVGMMFVYTRITKRPIEFVDWYLMLIYIGIGIAMGFASTGIDNFAHLGGLVSGMVVGAVCAMLTKRKERAK